MLGSTKGYHELGVDIVGRVLKTPHRIHYMPETMYEYRAEMTY